MSSEYERSASEATIMRRFAAVTSILLMLSAVAFAEGDDEMKGTKLTGPHNPFTFICPEGCQHETFESKVEKPNEKFEFKVNAFCEKHFTTDNFSLLWYEGEAEGFAKGAVSLHRVEMGREITPDMLTEEMEKDENMPPDAKAELMQLGKYVGISAGGEIEDLAMHDIFIINGKILYLGTLTGPKDAVGERRADFIAIMSSLAALDVKPAKLEDMEGDEEDRANEPAPANQVKARNSDFTLLLPEGWQYTIYDNPADKPNAELILKMATIGGQANVTDNMNFWWNPQGENMLLGLASIHRLEAQQELSPKSLLTLIKASGKVPPGMEVNLAQIGPYVGVLGGGIVQAPFYAAVAVIAQGKAMYVASILGPQATVTPQWQKFMGLVGSLKAPDLKPQELEDIE
jgi:hypothetical protein